MTYALIPLESLLSNAHSPSESELESFSKCKDKLLNTNTNESEGHQKIALMDFLKDSFSYECNTKGRIDLAIYEQRQAQVLFEVKSLKNKAEFIDANKMGGGVTLFAPEPEYNLECKAFYESILYFLREYETHKNNSLKYIILTNTRDFYLIDAREYLTFAKDTTIREAFDHCDKNQGTNTSTQKFYDTLKDYLPRLDSTLQFTYVNIQKTPKALLYQILSPQVLLKQKAYIDANTLNQDFYDELLYILGLQEVNQNGKILILPTTEPNTLLDSICNKLKLDREQDFEIIFSLLTTWNNRILFLRLLESMLLSFKHIDKPFLDIDTLQNFTDLNTLFFDILALKKEQRNTNLNLKDSIPYLNSSLFDKTELEKQNKEISRLDSNHLAIFKHSILKKDKDYKDTQSLPLLDYLFTFLHAYDFTTTPQDIINHTKTNHDKLINAAVLGLVFEKLNGYKEGSFYTPSFITSYMCKESLEKVVIDKFNTAKSWVCDSIESLTHKIDKLTDSANGYKEANKIFDSIKVCDPAVGSGHFLVSMLNSMIELKFRLKILCEISTDESGRRDYKRLKDIDLRLENDEILIQDSNNALHTYQIPAHDKLESHKIQKAIFHNKRILIESCLFGVDINPNSCEITKLRLWIELLKYSFYIFDSNGKNTGTLETLPNIDINIKCGNSLISRFDLQDSLNIKNIEQEIQIYKNLVIDYKNNKDITAKQKIQDSIKNLKEKFKIFIKANNEQDKLRKGIDKHLQMFGTFALGEWINETTFIFKENMNSGIGAVSNILEHKTYAKSFEPTDSSKKNEAFKSASKLLNLRMQIDDKLSAKGYENAFEWRFEFPEVLSDGLTKEQITHNNQLKQKGISNKKFEKQKFHSNAGDFLGFDIIIGNPPYIRQEEIKHLKSHLQTFRIYKGTSDIYTYFYEQGHKILKHNGILSFITSNKWCRAGYGEPLREFLLTDTKILSYIELNGIKVFDSASVDTSILSFAKAEPSKDTSFSYAYPKDYNPKDNKPLQDFITKATLLQATLTKESFVFLSDTESKIKAKIENIGTPLKEWDISIYRGILTGYNEAFIIDSAKREEILHHCDDTEASLKPYLSLQAGREVATMRRNDKGERMLTERERTELLIKPILRGRDIRRYSYEWAGLWIIFMSWHFPNTDNPKSMEENEQDLSEQYPSLYRHLSQHKEKLMSRNKSETGIRYEWYCLQRWGANYHQEFAKEKIVYPNMASEFIAYLDAQGFFTNQKCFILTDKNGKNLHYLTAILNSKANFWYFKQIGATLGASGYEMSKIFVEKLPIPQMTESNKPLCDEITALVEQILESKAKDSKADTTALESRIDSLVYTLYGLNPEEIEIIEKGEQTSS